MPRAKFTRPATERLVTAGIIAALHVLAIGAIWTRHLLVEQEPGPLMVNPIDAVVPEMPPPPPPVLPSIATPPVVLAPPLPPTIEVLEEPSAAITAKESPAEMPASAPALTSGEITEARFDVDYLNNPKPAYPPLSRRLREEGVVVLKVHVRSDGTVEAAVVDKRSGSMRLDEAALAAVKQWHFIPARRGSEPVDSWVLVPIEFELQT